MPYLDRFLSLLDSLPNVLIYLLLGLSSFIENVFPPAPGDTVTAFGAFLVGTKRIGFLGMYVATILGSLSGFMFLFWVGGLVGRKFFIEKDRWCFKAEDIIRAEKWFIKYGYFLVLLNRFMPGVRSVISIVAGLTRLHPIKVCLLALISSGLWNMIWIAFGYTLGANWETARDRLQDIFSKYNLAILLVFIILIVMYLLKKLIKRRATH